MGRNLNDSTRKHHGALNAADPRGDLSRAKVAKSCRCPSPVTYQEDDGEWRCICGRQARRTA